MDERDMEEEGKDRKGKGWGIGKKYNIENIVKNNFRLHAEEAQTIPIE
jgi:hypothetical protein